MSRSYRAKLSIELLLEGHALSTVDSLQWFSTSAPGDGKFRRGNLSHKMQDRESD